MYLRCAPSSQRREDEFELEREPGGVSLTEKKAKGKGYSSVGKPDLRKFRSVKCDPSSVTSSSTWSQPGTRLFHRPASFRQGDQGTYDTRTSLHAFSQAITYGIDLLPLSLDDDGLFT
ncbi:hypothetical protein Agabi119p4_2410 [Agaricus bisporus var. burnettii]|uniref:Uncharacterized protein n=1 Tax=Agaricus bisporus var. burnettii TaxID=192524 RepID=A0A8H7F941_AGABI|nr:hypothetical protein Agabi119p4_2410 [Agaricus bisporus var. burnettii]